MRHRLCVGTYGGVAKHLLGETMDKGLWRRMLNWEKEEMKRKEKKERKCVHTEHCCVNCGCKYGDEDCPVVLGLKKQSNPCGQAYTCAEGW